MIVTLRAAAVAAAISAACAFATPSLALNIESIPAATVPIVPVTASTSARLPSPNGLGTGMLTLNPPAPFIQAAPSKPAPALPLSALVDARSSLATMDADRECVATAVYFEARGEPLEGQLAVAQVVLNRAASGKYPSSVCAVVKQTSQFSFVRRGRVPPIARATEAWRKAVAIAQIAWERLAHQIGTDVLWYHASYVAPGWGRRLKRVARIGTHIFYN